MARKKEQEETLRDLISEIKVFSSNNYFLYGECLRITRSLITTCAFRCHPSLTSLQSPLIVHPVHLTG